MTSVPEQGPPTVQAVRETKRIVSVGMQQRSIPHFIEAKQKFSIQTSRADQHGPDNLEWENSGYLFKVRKEIRKKPADLDWEACLGWLPEKNPGMRKIFQPLRLLGFQARAV